MTKSQRSKYDVVLIQPNVVWVYDPFEHMGLAYLAASLRREGLKVKIIDAVLERLSMAQLYKEVCDYAPQVVGVTLISHGYKTTVRLLEHLRKALPESKFVGGGHFATFAAKKIMDDTDVFDAIAVGEADLNFVDYCKRYVLGEKKFFGGFMLPDGPTLQTGRPTNFADLPFPDRDYLPLSLERGAHASVTSSRGCYARCTFCTVHSFYQRKDGKRWFGRPIENIIEELATLRERFGIEHFNFVDDNFVGAGPAGRERTIEFAEKYKASGLPMTFHIDCRANDVSEKMIDALVDAGLTSVFCGIESINKQDIIDFRKGLKTKCNWTAVEILRSRGVSFTLSMIMFNPRTTRSSIVENVNYLKSVGYYPRNPIAILNIYEGTDLAKIYKEYVYGPFWDYKFRFEHEETTDIHRAALEFCKETLPLERVLSLGVKYGHERRIELNRIRLFALGDIAENWGTDTVENILEPWQQAVERLIRTSPTESVSSTDSAKFGRERLYINQLSEASQV